MRRRPQFSLSGVLVIILAMALPLALVATRQVVAVAVGISLLPIGFCSFVGQLFAGTEGAALGLWIGIAGHL